VLIVVMAVTRRHSAVIADAAGERGVGCVARGELDGAVDRPDIAPGYPVQLGVEFEVFERLVEQVVAAFELWEGRDR
jgi:hypothetical protein